MRACRRTLLHRFHERLWAGDGQPAVLQRVRAAPGSDLRVRCRDPAIHHRGAGGRGITSSATGTQSRDFCFIDNTVEANLAAASAPAAAVSGGVFNVACGAATTLNDVVRLISEIVGHPVPITYAQGRVGDVKHSLADITAARERLGYRGAITFAEGLKRTAGLGTPPSARLRVSGRDCVGAASRARNCSAVAAA